MIVGAVDLGSNSFHMVLARYLHHDIHVLDRLREPVRLAAGLGEDGRLSAEAQERAFECLRRFGDRLRHVPRDQVRAVGTNTFRKARNARAFRTEAERALGIPIEVISGQEEARLIYQGVSHLHPLEGRRRLVVDIGGGSTEIIVGREFEVLRSHSLYMGCVSYSQRYFPNGELKREFFRKAEVAAELDLSSVAASMRQLGWDVAAGASGTINAISELLSLNSLGGPGITLPSLKELRRAVLKAPRVAEMDLEGLKPDRAEVLPGGLAILIATFKALEVESLWPSPGALREGVLFDLVGRIEHQDVRERTVQTLVDRYHVDIAQAARVEQIAGKLCGSMADSWDIDRDFARKLLTWASLLHEIGLVVSHNGYHRHGAYLVANTDLPGFSADDQALLSVLVRVHRRKLSPGLFDELSPERARIALRLGVLMRLAVLLNRSRPRDPVPEPQVRWSSDGLRVTLDPNWLRDHPLTLADLEQEADYLRDVGIDLEFEPKLPV
jgi:exopolyphosphatase/guanosine-5'-triphosphate,3'-diphosphate pyrophosphatase